MTIHSELFQIWQIFQQGYNSSSAWAKKLFHFNLMLPDAEELWMEIPKSSIFTSPQS